MVKVRIGLSNNFDAPFIVQYKRFIFWHSIWQLNHISGNIERKVFITVEEAEAEATKVFRALNFKDYKVKK